MIRNLKALVVAAMALAALGAINASGAQAAEGKFHCSIAPCSATLRPDGSTGKEKHHVLVISNGVVSASATCNEISGRGTSSNSTTKEITFISVEYFNCTLAGSFAEVRMNSCDYLFTDSGEVHVQCMTAGDAIEIIAGACKLKIGPQTRGSVAYTSLFGSEITASPKVVNVLVAASGCSGLGLPDGTYAKSTYTTGNTIAHSLTGFVWYE